MATERNILVGAAAMYLAASGVAKPTYGASTVKYTTTLDALATWPSVGYTTDGVEVSYQPDYGEVPVDQLLDAALLFKQAMTVSLNTTFAEATLSNLSTVWGQTSAALKTGAVTGFDGETMAAGETQLGMQAGALGGAPTERQLIAVGNGPRAVTTLVPQERAYYARRVLSVDTSAHSLARDTATVFPVSFRLLPDGTKTNAEYGTIYDRITT